jgi:exodeoxyribonuclease VII small subunit
MSDDPTTQNHDDSFEAMLKRLQDTVAELEAGGIELERSIELYKLGMELAKRCENLLSEAELTVKTIADSSSPEEDEDFSP